MFPLRLLNFTDLKTKICRVFSITCWEVILKFRCRNQNQQYSTSAICYPSNLQLYAKCAISRCGNVCQSYVRWTKYLHDRGNLSNAISNILMFPPKKKTSDWHMLAEKTNGHGIITEAYGWTLSSSQWFQWSSSTYSKKRMKLWRMSAQRMTSFEGREKS